MYKITQKIWLACTVEIYLAVFSKVSAQNPITVSKIIHEGKSSYVEVNGQPYLMYGRWYNFKG
ncbi:MAG: hypothetical protein ACKOXB_00585 [Flavobacteriales bacterium]